MRERCCTSRARSAFTPRNKIQSLVVHACRSPCTILRGISILLYTGDSTLRPVRRGDGSLAGEKRSKTSSTFRNSSVLHWKYAYGFGTLQVMWLVWIGYGVVGGCGIGLCYISPVSALQKWFPDHRGLASGVAVSGFGSGSIVMAKVQVEMLDWVGLPSTFLILGFIYLVAMGVAGMVLRTPPPGFSPSSMESKEEVKEEDEMSLLESLKSLDFRLLYVAFLANIIFGLVLISRFSNIVTDIFHKDADTAATVVSINGGFNLGARLVVSLTSDYLGRKNCYIILLTTQLIILATFSTLTTSQSYYSFLSAMWILTACYGAGFSVIPAFLADKFGPKNVGACHGVLLTAWSMAAVVGGVVFTLIFNHYSSQDNVEDPFPYNINTWWLCGVVFLGWLALLFVKPTKKDVQVWKGVTCRK